MKIFYSHSRSAFTLIELMIALLIFMIMSSMIFFIYAHISKVSHQLKISRELSESSREVTEYIAEIMKNEGIGIFPETKFDPVTSHIPWQEKYDEEYRGMGGEILPIGKNVTLDSAGNAISTPKKYIVYGRKEESNFYPCSDDDQKNPNIHCGLYVAENGIYTSLIDRSHAEEKDKRIKLVGVRFFISQNEGNAPKVTLKMTLQLAQRSGVSSSMLKKAKIQVQTTFSSRPYLYQ